MIHIALADEYQLMRDGFLQDLLDQEHINLAIQAFDGIDLLDQMAKKKVDVVILDLNLPIMNGKKTMDRIRSIYGNSVTIIMIGVSNNLHFVRKYMHMGASAYLEQSVALPILIEAIETVHAGKLFFEPHVPEELRVDINAIHKAPGSI